MKAMGGGRWAAWAARLLLLGALLLGFGLRIYELEGQSMWSDEGLSLYRARLPVAANVQNIITVDGIDTRDTNPPFYFLLLHGWRAVAGETVFALRFLGSVAGLLAVPLLYVMGTAVYGRWVGLAAALLMALSPFHVWQSQVLRNYGLLVTLNLFSLYGLARFTLAAGPRRSRWLALWAAAGLLGIYTHYFGFFILAFGLLVLLVWAVTRRGVGRWLRRRWLWFAGGLILLLLILAPIVPVALERFNAGQQIDFYRVPAAVVVEHAAHAFSVGMSPTLMHPWLLVWPALLLAVLGVVFGWRRNRGGTLFLLGYQFIPLGLLLLLSTVNPLYNGTRHLLIGLPPFLLFAAVGLVAPLAATQRQNARWLRRGAAVAAVALAACAIVIQAFWLRAQFTDPALVRDDVRGAAEFLTAQATADDVIVLHDTLIGFTFNYYYAGAAPVTAVPRYGEQDVAAAEAALAAAAADAERVWFLTSPTPRTGFPRTALRDWAEQQWPRIAEVSFPSMWLDVAVRGYTPQPVRAALPATAQPLEATFGEMLRLHGVTYPATMQAGVPSWWTFYWSRLRELPEDYKLTLRLVDEQGQEWQQSNRGLWRTYRPNAWPENAMVRYDHEVDLATGLPPGRYEVWLRVEDDALQPLRTESGAEEVYLGPVDVTAGNDVTRLPPHVAQRQRVGPLTLLGYALPDTELRPGHLLPIDLFWQARRTPVANLNVRVELLDGQGTAVAEAVALPTRTDYPTTLWQPGEVLQSKVDLLIPATAAAEDYRLRISLVDAETRAAVAQPATLSEAVAVTAWPMQTEFPAIATPFRADFGAPATIELHGYDLAPASGRAGETLTLTLYWRAAALMVDNYDVFVHLVDESGQVVTQGDGPPLNGFRPTVSWRPGEVFSDEHLIPIPPELAPGAYRLWVGFYNRDTGERLPAAVDGEAIPEGTVILQQVEIE